jgi:hypothetical protein
MTRLSRLGGAGSSRFGCSTLAQPPKALRTSAKAASFWKSPTTTSTAPLGAYQRPAKAFSSSRVSFFTAAGDGTVKPYGSLPKTALFNCSSARNSGEECCSLISSAKLLRASSTSPAGNAGWRATSASSSNSFGAISESASPSMVVPSASVEALMLPPMARSSSRSALLERVAVPSVSTRAASCATPGCVVPSVARSAGKASRAVIFGTFGSGTSTTVRPFSSLRSSIFGHWVTAGGAGGGGVFCSASRGSASSAIAIIRFISSPPARGPRRFGWTACSTSSPRPGSARR